MNDALLAQGVPLVLGDVTGQIDTAWQGTIAAFAKNGVPQSKGRCAGVFPFTPTDPGWLYALAPAERPPAVTAEVPSPPQAQSGAWQFSPAPEVYGAAVEHAVDQLRSYETPLQKVVLARALDYRTAAPVDPMAVARRLGQDPHVTSYALPVPQIRSGKTADAQGDMRWLVGATPELLLDKKGAAVMSHPLAGSAPRSADPVEDRRRAEALLVSTKDLAEHRYVVEYIHDILAPYCHNLTTPQTPALQKTASMWHLGTRISGVLRDADLPCLALLGKLHPTPAVAGTPLRPALDLISRLEPEPRGFYAGTVGWLENERDGTWYVTLRCAMIEGCMARLHAGAGIVPDSTAAAEIAETQAKFIAMSDALGIDLTH
ncbi:isochorismate synthase [Thioclava sp. GXIMD4216]|uniref:isochorismate synthase n=1 Tax=Thioclava sp. GXIMD4216 TaxID=3131929 RepID=UPI0030D49820